MFGTKILVRNFNDLKLIHVNRRIGPMCVQASNSIRINQIHSGKWQFQHLNEVQKVWATCCDMLWPFFLSILGAPNSATQMQAWILAWRFVELQTRQPFDLRTAGTPGMKKTILVQVVRVRETLQNLSPCLAPQSCGVEPLWMVCLMRGLQPSTNLRKMLVWGYFMFVPY